MIFVSLYTFIAALLSAILFLRPSRRLLALTLWPVKLVASALAPLLALLSASGLLLGLLRRDWKLVAAGFFGAGLAARYTQEVTEQKGDFAQAFGPDWQRRLPVGLETQFLPRRWSPWMAIPDAYSWQPNIIFGRNPETGSALLADIWQPTPGSQRTGLAIINMHGGAWRMGDKDMGTRPLFSRLASQGHVIMDIAYTLAPGTPIEVMVQDVKRAILWMKKYAGNYGVNPDTIVLMGASAGGHLALLSAYTPNLPDLQPDGEDGDTSVHGVVAFYPPVDFFAAYENARSSYGDLMGKQDLSPIDRANLIGLSMIGMVPDDPYRDRASFLTTLLDGTPDEVPERYRLLSPISHVGPLCPPTLLLQGSDDFFQLAPAVRRMHESLLRAGATSILVEYPHTDHAFDIVLPQVSPPTQAATYEIERFLALLM